MDDKTSQQKKDQRTLYIILIWVGVAVVSLAAIMLTMNGNKNIKKIDLKWNQVQFDKVIEANFTFEEVTTVTTDEDLKAVIGISPALTVPEEFGYNWIRKFIPLDESGNQIIGQTNIGIGYYSNSDNTRWVHSYVSSTNNLNLIFPNSEYNRDLRNPDEVWTIVDESRCKLFKIYAGVMDSQYSYAIFEKDGHFWHIEFSKMTDDEIAQIIYYAMIETTQK